MPARKYFKEDFDRILNEEFHGDKLAMRRSSYANRRLYIYAVEKKWTKPLDLAKLYLKYPRDEFDRRLKRFNGNVYRMANDSDENRKFIEAAKRHGWIPRNRPNQHDRPFYIYMFAFPPVPSKNIGISIYIGLTSRRPEERMINHVCSHKSSVHRFSATTGLPIPDMSILERGLSSEDASRMECIWIERFRDMGWNVLNRIDGGGLGAYRAVRWTPEIAISKINECSSRTEFEAKHYNAYRAILHNSTCSEKWSSVRKYMETKFKIAHWNRHSYEECLRVARGCGSYDEFRTSHNGCYRFARRRGMLGRICSESGMRQPTSRKISVVGIPVSGCGGEVQFESINEAAAFAGTNAGRIRGCITGKWLESGGYMWKSTNRTELNRRPDPSARHRRCDLTFDSVLAVARKLESYSELRYDHQSEYRAAIRNGWMDDIIRISGLSKKNNRPKNCISGTVYSKSGSGGKLEKDNVPTLVFKSMRDANLHIGMAVDTIRKSIRGGGIPVRWQNARKHMSISGNGSEKNAAKFISWTMVDKLG